MYQRVDVAITEDICLKLSEIVGMTRHMVGTDRETETRLANGNNNPFPKSAVWLRHRRYPCLRNKTAESPGETNPRL
jgi:hypothetical protein